MILIIPLILLLLPEIYNIRAINNYKNCKEQLISVKTGLDKYKATHPSLDNISVPDDICHFILPGYKSAAECKGLVRKKIDGKNGSCAEDTFEFSKLPNHEYQISASQNLEPKCGICVTEKSVYPDKFEDCKYTHLFSPLCEH